MSLSFNALHWLALLFSLFGSLLNFLLDFIMKQYNPFPDVGPCPYGSPMGRRSDNPRDLQPVNRLAARRQGGGDGYDKGGAYWGLPSNVWGVWGTVNGEILCTYVRAYSRDHAIRLVRDPVY